jgi:hypothetical protein
MISNWFRSLQETANFARGVYFLATLIVLGISEAPRAQMLDLGDLQKWKYSGESRESHKGHACLFSPGILKRDAITRRFLQDYQFNIAPKGNQKAVSYTVLQRANIRLLSPSTCPENTKTCQFEFLVEAVGSASESPEKYLVVLTAKESSPTDLLGVEMFYYGESTGQKRLYVDCSELSRSESSRR